MTLVSSKAPQILMLYNVDCDQSLIRSTSILEDYLPLPCLMRSSSLRMGTSLALRKDMDPLRLALSRGKSAPISPELDFRRLARTNHWRYRNRDRSASVRFATAKLVAWSAASSCLGQYFGHGADQLANADTTSSLDMTSKASTRKASTLSTPKASLVE